MWRNDLFERNTYAVSEVVGYAIVFGMFVAFISSILLWGVPLMDDEKADVSLDNVYNQFNEIDTALQDMIGQGVDSSQMFNIVTNKGYVSIGDMGERIIVYYSLEPIFDFNVSDFTEHSFRFTTNKTSDNYPPVAHTGGPYYAYANNTITFDASLSNDSDGNITGYRWDFNNDGTYDTDWLTAQKKNYSYSIEKTYTAKLEVKDDDGATDTATTPVMILDRQIPISQGKDIVLVLDSSGSMNYLDIQDVKDAALSFVDELLPSSSIKIGIIDFDTSPSTVINPTNNRDDLLTAIYNVFPVDDATYYGHPTGRGATDWEEAIDFAQSTLDTTGSDQNVMVIVTDGNPTTGDTSVRHSHHGSGYTGIPNDLIDAAAAANDSRDAGTQIFAIGIDNAAGGPNIENLERLTENVFVGDIADLTDMLKEVAEMISSQQITVRKLVDGIPAENWEFDVEVTGGMVNWSSPLTSNSDNKTDENGVVTYGIELDDGVTIAFINITETIQGETTFISAAAWNASSLVVFSDDLENHSITDIPIGKNENIYCEFINIFNSTLGFNASSPINSTIDTYQIDIDLTDPNVQRDETVAVHNLSLFDVVQIDLKGTNPGLGLNGTLGRIWIFDLGYIKYDLPSMSGNHEVIIENGGIHKGHNSLLLDEPNMYNMGNSFLMRIIKLKPTGFTSAGSHMDTAGIYHLLISINHTFILEEEITIPQYLKMQVYGDYKDSWIYYFKTMQNFNQWGNGILYLEGERNFSLTCSLLDVEMDAQG